MNPDSASRKARTESHRHDTPSNRYFPRVPGTANLLPTLENRRWEAMLTLIDERQPWIQWQHSVVRLLRTDFTEALHHIGFDEVDWASWRALYDEGRSPRAAIDRALERDF